ncbi:MAG TPA: hypothetical protein VH143_02635 [Kofleriaceae bacterium]|jgi:hypothetical protein|nr:hypothetical protein [Kofleriaceae bacterium]
MTTCPALIAALAMTASCVGATGELPLHTGARYTFARASTCPVESVDVRSRTEIPAHMLVSPPSQPPAEVAADAKRLVTWRNDEVQRESAIDATYRSYEASGCGSDALYVCARATDADLAATRLSSAVKCFPATTGVTTVGL